MAGLKTLVVALVILIVAAILISPGGIERAGKFIGSVESWLGENLGGITAAPAAANKALTASIEPVLPFALKTDAPLNITSGSVHVNGFSGEMVISKENVSLFEANTGLKLILPANGTTLSGFRINTLSLDGIGFYISPNITTSSGNISITGFYGSGSIDYGKLSLEGNVTRLKASIGGVLLEI